MVQARNVRVRLFEGDSRAKVEYDVNAFLRNTVEEELVDIEYSYAAPRPYTSAGAKSLPGHGVCVVLAERPEPPSVTRRGGGPID